MVLPTDAPAKPVVSLDISYRSSRGRQDETHLLLQPDALTLAVDRMTSDLPPAALLSPGPADPNHVAVLYGKMDVAGTVLIPMPTLLLYLFFPFFTAMRVPARFALMAILSVSLLAGAGAASLAERAKARAGELRCPSGWRSPWRWIWRLCRFR